MASRFWVGGTGTWDGSTTTHWSATSGGAGGVSVPGSSDDVTIDSSSGSPVITVNTNFNVNSLTFTGIGTLDLATNNNSPTIGSSGMLVNGSAVRTINMGSGTWTFTMVIGTPIDFFGVSNLTFNANTSTVLLSATATGERLLNLYNGVTFNNFTVTNPTANSWPIAFQSNSNGHTFNFANFTLTNVRNVYVHRAPITFVVSTAFTWAGGTAYNDAAIFEPTQVGGSLSGALMLNVANVVTMSYVAINGITKAGAGSITCSNSLNAGNNSGITFNAPSGGSSSIIGS